MFQDGLSQHVNRLLQEGTVRLPQSLPLTNPLKSEHTLYHKTRAKLQITSVRRAILPKRPPRRANPSLDGRLGNTANTQALCNPVTNRQNTCLLKSKKYLGNVCNSSFAKTFEF